MVAKNQAVHEMVRCVSSWKTDLVQFELTPRVKKSATCPSAFRLSCDRFQFGSIWGVFAPGGLRGIWIL